MYRQRSEPFYHTAQYCLNGHNITPSMELYSAKASKYCGVCGATTITQCPGCSANIRGYYDVPGVAGLDRSPIPKYCYNCGVPFPWTEQAIATAKALIDESDASDADKKVFAENVEKVARDTPETPLAAGRLRKIITAAGKPVGDLVKEVVVKIATEAAMKTMFPTA